MWWSMISHWILSFSVLSNSDPAHARIPFPSFLGPKITGSFMPIRLFLWIVGTWTLVFTWQTICPLSHLTSWYLPCTTSLAFVTLGIEQRAFHFLGKYSACHGVCSHPHATENTSWKGAKSFWAFCRKVVCAYRKWKYELMNCYFYLPFHPSGLPGPSPWTLLGGCPVPPESEKRMLGVSKQSLVSP